MRALVLILALTVACAAAALADAESPGSTDSASGTNEAGTHATMTTTMGSQEEMADACIASSIGLTRQQVQDLRSQGFTYADIAMAQAIAKKACKDICDVLASWKECKNWPDTAKKYGLSVSDLMRFPMIGSPDTETFNLTFISEYFGFAKSDIAQLRKDGFAWDEIYLIANASVRTGQPITQIASLRSKGMSWSDIAAKYNMALSDMICPAPAKRVVTSSGAGPTCPPPCPAGPITCPTVMYTSTGSILLTTEMVCCLYAEGNDWLDVAIASNMTKVTGIPIRWFLQQVRNGRQWLDLIYKFNVDALTAFNVTDYPFDRRSVYSADTDRARLAMVERFQRPGCKGRAAEWPVMVGRMPTASPSYYR